MDYRIIMLDLPTTVKGYVLQTFDGFNTIVLNSRLNVWQNRKTLRHELDHIINDDLHADLTAAEIEKRRHA